MTARSDFGIYVKTFRADYHLAKALVASLWERAPGCEITLIPDDHYQRETLWGLPAMRAHNPFMRRLRGYYKKLWVFYGPYERFIYLDADMLALAPLEPLLRRVREAEPPFFFTCAESKFLDLLAKGDGAARDETCRKHIGELDLLARFDPQYDPRAAFPFNSGCFATHRDVFPHELLRERFEAAKAFHNPTGAKPLCFSRKGIFMGDQGFLNYMLAKRGVAPDLLVDLWHWGGRPAPDNVEAQRAADPCKHLFVHWAGCPRPSLFATSAPWAAEWRRCFGAFHRQAGGASAWWSDVVTQALDDCRAAVKRRLAGRFVAK